jgi:geranylgeranyl pyrophosphate synthase
MNFNDYSHLVRKHIAETIRAELAKATAIHPSFSGSSAHIFDRIEEYSLAGKMLRAVLACLSTELFSKAPLTANDRPATYILGAAL